MKITASSKLTSKSQATIPRPIRDFLGVRPGDSVVFEIERDQKVIVRKATPMDIEFLRAVEGTLSEWSSQYDEEAYGDL